MHGVGGMHDRGHACWGACMRARGVHGVGGVGKFVHGHCSGRTGTLLLECILV